MDEDPSVPWETAAVMTGALWVAGAIDQTGPGMVARVQKALSYAAHTGRIILAPPVPQTEMGPKRKPKERPDTS